MIGTFAEKVWSTWESKEELLIAIERNNKIGEMATMNGNDDIFDKCLERNQIMQQCKRGFALHENKGVKELSQFDKNLPLACMDPEDVDHERCKLSADGKCKGELIKATCPSCGLKSKVSNYALNVKEDVRA